MGVAMTRWPSVPNAVLLAVVLGLAACGGEGGPEGVVMSSDPFCRDVLPRVDAFMAQARVDHPTPADERYGGTVVLGNIGELTDGMNSAVTSSYYPRAHQIYLNLMPLIRYDEETVPQPYLAESWEVSPDNTEITFHIRRDVFWHDGEQTTAHDVAFTYRTVTNPETAFPLSAYVEHYDKREGGVEVVDDFTVKVRLNPHSEFLDFWTLVGILPEHLLAEVPPAKLKQHPYGSQCPVGNGPFVFSSHQPQDRWVFTANPAYPKALGGRPFLDRYIYRIIPEQTTLLAELLIEEVDVYIRPRTDQARRISEAEDVDLLSFPWREYAFVAWNARKPQLSDARVRRAITLGTNRAEITQAMLQGYGTVSNSGVPPFHWAFDPDVHEQDGYDPDAAMALLDDAGWMDRDGDGVRENADGLPLSFSIKSNTGNQQRQDVAEIMQSQLAEIGMEVRPQLVEMASMLLQINSPDLRDFDGVAISAIEPFRLDHTDRFHSASSGEPWAYAGTNNPQIDELLEKLSTTVDREEARPMWAEYQRVIAQEAPYTYFYFPDGLAGVNKRLKGVIMDARGELVSIRDWYIDPASGTQGRSGG
jgi:peptide/nickel transport system substrate-binding protein